MSELKLRPPKKRHVARMVAGIQKQERSLVASLCRDDSERQLRKERRLELQLQMRTATRKATAKATVKDHAQDNYGGQHRRRLHP
jgi:hypothetical protein